MQDPPVTLRKLVPQDPLTKFRSDIERLVSVDQQTVQRVDRLGLADCHVNKLFTENLVLIDKVQLVLERKDESKARVVLFLRGSLSHLDKVSACQGGIALRDLAYSGQEPRAYEEPRRHRSYYGDVFRSCSIILLTSSSKEIFGDHPRTSRARVGFERRKSTSAGL